MEMTLGKYALIDCRPVPAKLAPELLLLKRETGAVLQSCLRTQDAVNYARSRGCRLSSQAELYMGWVRRLPGYNPANPPGYSTHELRNDGAAYSWLPRGVLLRYWMVGQDWDDGHIGALIRAARKRGWIVTVTYPGSRSEYHHLNFRKEPKLKVFRPLKLHSKGPRVAVLTARLAYLGFLHGVSPRRGTGGFGPQVRRAVLDFQHKYHLAADGVVGIHTHRQIVAAVKGRKKCRRAALKIKGATTRQAALERCSRRFGP